jgi:hypothetical protein
MKERTVPRRQLRLVYYTRDQLDELCVKRSSWTSAWRATGRN